MMSGHGANPIFFNKKKKDWTSRTFANPPLPTSDNISFLPYPPTPPPPPPLSPHTKWTSYVYHPLRSSGPLDLILMSIGIRERKKMYKN